MKHAPKLLSGLVGAVALLMATTAMPARAADNVTVQLDWVVRGDHSIFFVARDKGYFKENGINITAIRKGTGTPDALRLVGNGNAEFGFGDLPTLAVSRSEGVPDVAIAAVNVRSPLAIIAIAKRHMLKKPADLKGLNIGIHPAGSTYIFFKAFLKANGMSEADMHESTVSPPYENYLLLGRVDVVPGYIDAEVPELEAKAGGKGSLSVLLGADYGWTVLGSGLFTSDKMIAEKSDLVRRFTAAYIKAFKDVIADPKGAIAITAKANPEYEDKQGVLLEQLDADIQHSFTNADTKAHGLGWMPKTAWDQTQQVMTEQGVLKTPVKVESLYTNKFVDAAAK